MDLDGASLLGGEIDKSKIPPIHQKRILAFVNHFILTTCTFLNTFLSQCESKFIEIERKLQKVEASLLILEAKLASIPDIDPVPVTESKQEENTQKTPEYPNTQVQDELPSESKESQNVVNTDEINTDLSNENIDEKSQDLEETTPEVNGIKANEDARYRKYFKMVQFGVPPPAVKLKMASEGLIPEILDTPNLILPDGVPYEAPES